MIDKTADVSQKAKIGRNVKIWAYTKVREGVKIGSNSIVGQNVYIDFDVEIGSRVKIQNNSLIYHGAKVEDEVFIGPAVILTNDKYPRSTNTKGNLKSKSDWKVGQIIIHKGASIGAGSIILPGIEVGYFSMVGAGSVVTKNVSNFTLVLGNPAKIIGKICTIGHINKGPIKKNSKAINYFCKICNKNYEYTNK